MFGSQALETAIGLVLMFFLFATAASAITEFYAAYTKKRSKDLEAALMTMFNTGTLPGGWTEVTSKDVQAFIKTATGTTRTSYLSAKGFADAVTELVSKGEYLGGVAARLDSLSRQAKGRLDTAKAGLETWFDQTMATVQDNYSKWASFFLFGTGLVLAIALNASAVNVGQDLWSNAAARQAVVEAASSAGTVSAACNEQGSVVEQAQCDVTAISAFQLPLGWGENQRAGWNAFDAAGAWWWLSHIIGWLLTAVLLMLGAPFWFDLLGKLVNLRAGGPRPEAAPDDETSYSRKVIAKPPETPDPNQWVPNADKVNTQISQGNEQGPTLEDLHLMAPTDRLLLYRAATPAIFAPPNETEAENVDWLATALNLGVPMEVVRDRVAAATAVGADKK